MHSSLFVSLFIVRRFVSWHVSKGMKRGMYLSDTNRLNDKVTKINNFINIKYFGNIDFNNCKNTYEVDNIIINNNKVEILLYFQDTFINIYYVKQLIDFLDNIDTLDNMILDKLKKNHANKGIVYEYTKGILRDSQKNLRKIVKVFNDKQELALLEKIQVKQIAIYPEDTNFCQLYYMIEHNKLSILTVNIDSDFSIRSIDIENQC